MSFYRFEKDDILNVKISTFPYHTVELNGNQVTGSVFLENSYLASQIKNRMFIGFSERLGGLTAKSGNFSSSIDLVTAISGGTNKEYYNTALRLFNYYSLQNVEYTASFTSSFCSTYRIITIPQVYYDREILSATFTASDQDSAGATRVLYDNGRGGIYSGSLSGTLVGNIFYSEGIIVLKSPNLNDFGSASPNNFKWRVQFKGNHTIPVQVYRCRAPSGELNASTNPTSYKIAASGSYKNQKEKLVTGSLYVTQVGLYNEDYELVAVANIAQPIRKDFNQDLQIRLKLDW